MSNAISLLMPVFNSLTDEKGKYGFLSAALKSLKDQTLSTFELIILDNRSCDGTFEFCLEQAKLDDRITVIRDTKQRSPEEAIRVLAETAESEFCMIVNDDDHWDRDYLNILNQCFESDPTLDLVYSNGRYIDVLGKSQGLLDYSSDSMYNSDHSATVNYLRYLSRRNPFPISFGLFKRQILLQHYPAKRFDSYGMNLDNLFVANVIRSGAKIHVVDKELFFYRTRKRAPRLDFHGFSFTKSSALTALIELTVHQLRLCREFASTGRELPVSAIDEAMADQIILSSTFIMLKNQALWILSLLSLDKGQFRLVTTFLSHLDSLIDNQIAQHESRVLASPTNLDRNVEFKRLLSNFQGWLLTALSSSDTKSQTNYLQSELAIFVDFAIRVQGEGVIPGFGRTIGPPRAKTFTTRALLKYRATYLSVWRPLARLLEIRSSRRN